MTFYARRTERSVVRFEEHNAHNVVTDVTFALQLLRIVFLVRQQRRHVKHYFNAAPVRVHRIQS